MRRISPTTPSLDVRGDARESDTLAPPPSC
jgi:hypothetical protein